MRKYLPVLLLLLIATAVLVAAKDFVMPKPEHAAAYPMRDAHPAEKVTIAVVPYTGERAKVFKVRYDDYGIMPVYFVVSNDGDEPVQLTRMKIQLVTAARTRIEPATTDDLERRMSKTARRGDESNRTRLPIPLPGGKPKVGVSKDATEEFHSAQFSAIAVEPHSTRAGFLFFDVRGERDPNMGARVYITGVRNSEGQDLMYFEVPLSEQSANRY